MTQRVTCLITAEAYQAIRTAYDPVLDGEWHSKAVKLDDGSYLVPMDEDIFDRLKATAQPHEELSDTIIRAISTLNNSRFQ